MQQRRGTAAQWTAANPTLAAGEIGFETDTSKFKMGNGSSAWTALTYFANATELAAIVDGAPGLLNTLNELAQAIGDDPDFINTVAQGLTTHTNDSTMVHGIVDTALLATTGNLATTATAAATALAAHEADTTLVHGIVDTSLLATTANVATALSSATSALTDHAADTTLVHGIVNTADLVTQSDLTDAISGAAVNQESLAGTGIDWNSVNTRFDIDSTIATKTYADNAVSTHNSDTSDVHGIADTSALALTATVNTALDLKAPLASPTFTGTVSGITKTMVGLGSVDNTTDSAKPVSTATQTALDLKLNLAEPSVDYYVSNSGTGGYLVNGVLNGTINFVKGKKYRIIVNAVGHPFWIQTSYGAYNPADVYSTGVTNAGTDSGSILVELPLSAPDDLYYACQYHSTMKGTINSKPDELLDYATSSAATAYTITSANSAKTTEFTATTDVTITIPSDPSNTTWPIGTSLELRQMGVGRLIFSATSPATIVSTDGYLKTRTQYSSAFLEKRASNAWILTGDIDA